MENKQAVAVAVGVGAVGTALAYLGYSVYNNNDDISNLAEAQNNSWWANLWTNSNTDSETLLTEVDNPQLDASEEAGKNVKIKTPAKAWPTFWKNEYDADKKVKATSPETVETERAEVEASDYN